jgi:hypothetical protein
MMALQIITITLCLCSKIYQLPATFFVTAIRKEGYDILWNDFLTIASVTGPQLIFTCEMKVVYQTKTPNTYFICKRTGRTLAETLRDQNFPAKKKR